MRYFSRFPVVEYGGRLVRDVTRSVKVLDSVRGDRFAYYPLTVSSGERADSVSFRTFEDPGFDWLLYLSNDVVDPYYDWPLGDQEFNETMVVRYGSFERASRLITRYRLDWQSGITVGVPGFDSLPASERKYWESETGASGRIVGYRRAQLDWYLRTNHEVRMSLTGLSGVFQTAEPVRVTVDSSQPLRTGEGQVEQANGTHLTVQHVSGWFHPANDLPVSTASVVGEYSGASAQVLSFKVVGSCFPQANGSVTDPYANSEPSYWRPVSALEDEMSRNNSLRTIRIPRNEVVAQADEDLRSGF